MLKKLLSSVLIYIINKIIFIHNLTPMNKDMKNNITILANLYTIYEEIKELITSRSKSFISIVSAFLMVFLIRSVLAIMDTIFIIDEYPLQRIIFILSTSLMIMGLEIGFTKFIFINIDNKSCSLKSIFNYFHLLGSYVTGLLIFYFCVFIGTVPGFLYLYLKYSGEFITIIYTSMGDPYFQELISAYFNTNDILLFLFIIIIPTAYISIRLSFWSYYVIEKEISGITSIKNSYYLTQNKESEIVCYLFIILLFNLLGLLSIIGICFTIPITYLFLCKYYKLLILNHL